MSFVATADDQRRLWDGLGAVVFGYDTGADVDFHVTSRDGKVAIGTRPVTVASPVVATVGGYGITLPVVLIVGAALFLLVRK